MSPESRFAIGGSAAPYPLPQSSVPLVTPVDADATGIVEEQVHIVGWFCVIVEVPVDGIIDEITHHGIAVIVTQQFSLGIADGLVDQVLVPGVASISSDE